MSDEGGKKGEQAYELVVTGQRDVRFVGELVAETTSENWRNAADWTVLQLYRTRAGKFVGYKKHLTRYSGHVESFELKLFTTEDEIIEWFGLSTVAKGLYDMAGIDYTIEVD